MKAYATGWLVAVILATLALGGRAENGAVLASTTGGAETVRYSSAVNDVLTMLDKGVSPDIVMAFVENSSVAYQLDASEIIALTQRGVPADILSAMINRDGALRAQAVPPAQTSLSANVEAYPACGSEPVVEGYAAPVYYYPSSPAYSYWWNTSTSYGWPLYYSYPVGYYGYYGSHHYFHGRYARGYGNRHYAGFENRGRVFHPAGFGARPSFVPHQTRFFRPSNLGMGARPMTFVNRGGAMPRAGGWNQGRRIR
jgi:hypothetical protein